MVKLTPPTGWSGVLQVDGANYQRGPDGSIDVPHGSALAALLATGFSFPTVLVPTPSAPAGAALIVASVDVFAGAAIDATGSLADCTNASQISRVLGLATASALAGQQVPVAPSGLIVALAGWSAGDVLYLSTGGQLSASPPAAGFKLRVAVAVSPSLVAVSLGEPILLGA